ncbi:hypothetical protein, partial [Vibrio cholerae]|uniref:hypothetical protein n=1 Tax=Vibrio cholerae TaxID=666 RepID=UPI000A244327
MNTDELATAIDSIAPGRSIFDPENFDPTSPPALTQDDSSDEETRLFILKYDPYVPRPETSTPRVK